MIVEEIMKFAGMVSLYDQVCEIYVYDVEDIETIEKLSNDEKWDAIDTIYNTDGEFETGEEMFIEHFGKTYADMDALADEHGFSRVE